MQTHVQRIFFKSAVTFSFVHAQIKIKPPHNEISERNKAPNWVEKSVDALWDLFNRFSASNHAVERECGRRTKNWRDSKVQNEIGGSDKVLAKTTRHWSQLPRVRDVTSERLFTNNSRVLWNEIVLD